MFESMLSFPGGLFGEFDRLQRALDEAFGSAGMPASIRSVAPGAFPAVNIGSTPTSVEIYAFAPGIDPSKIEVTLDRGVLTLAGERPSSLPAQEAGVGVFGRERFAGAFRRAVALPDDADPARVEARYRDGVLCISVARREEVQPRRITVQ
ncbi:MAG TPA: Hsp20/alpha crystallin family protein [Ideonella sp.]|nr:Hsp20/alpha crystallin family protein [Ideonella sp.]